MVGSKAFSHMKLSIYFLNAKTMFLPNSFYFIFFPVQEKRIQREINNCLAYRIVLFIWISKIDCLKLL